MKFTYQRLMLKTSLIYLIIGVILGLFIFLSYQFKSFYWGYNLISIHTHLILIGFVIQMIMGVALWMFPQKPTREISIEKRFTTEKEGLTLYILLNIGIILRTLFEPFSRTNKLAFYIALIGILFQIVSIFYFLFLIFPRIRKPGEIK
ncbi:MAG: hypothetical protein ABIL76_00545 [candidate division WOR-3 bacterium]